MKYIVKNCPAYRAGMNLPHYCKAVGSCINTYVDGMDCTTVKNCLIKQVIDKCKHFKSALDYDKGSMFVAKEILDMFEIERVEE